MTDSSYHLFAVSSKWYFFISKQDKHYSEVQCPICEQKFVPNRRTLSISFSDDFRHWSGLQPILIPDAKDDEMAKERAPVVAMLPRLEDGADWVYGRGMEYRDKWRQDLNRALEKPAFARVDLPPAPGNYQ